MFSVTAAKEALKVDVSEKKTFESRYDFVCPLCSSKIFQGDEFVYLGNKRICISCKIETENLIDERI